MWSNIGFTEDISDFEIEGMSIGDTKSLADELPEGKKVGDVKTDEVSATYYSASVYGTVGLDSPDADNFTAYADVTEANAISWCEAKFTSDKLTAIEASLDAQIAEKKTPTKGQGMPWS